MKQKVVSVLILALLGVLVFWLSPLENKTENSQNELSKPQVCFKEYCFFMEIADNFFEQARGLMYRETLPEEQGMIFVYQDEKIYPFWMKNTLIPLDIIWISGENKVVYIKKNAQPCGADKCFDIIPEKAAKYVLEINGGLSDEMNLKVGDKLEIKL